jgi:hypothetical protein
MVSIQERANAFWDILDRPIPKLLLWAWSAIASWDTFVSQFIPEEISKKFPKVHQVIVMTSGWVSLQWWLVIGAALVALISLEWGARHKWKLELATGNIQSPAENTRPLLVIFWLSVAAFAIVILSLDAAHWRPGLISKSTPLPPSSSGVPTASPASMATPTPVPAQAAPGPSPAPKPSPPWVPSDQLDKQLKLGRKMLIYSPQELFAMYVAGQNLNVFVNRWFRIAGPTATVPIIEKIQSKDYYRVDINLDTLNYRERGVVSAYYDPKKYGDALVNIRPGEGIQSICQFSDLTRKVLNASYATYFTTIVAYNCEAP